MFLIHDIILTNILYYILKTIDKYIVPMNYGKYIFYPHLCTYYFLHFLVLIFKSFD